MNKAPILIPTLCRFDLFKQCVETLSECPGAEESVLFIALDFPLNESHKHGYEKIKNYIPNITGFKEVVTIRRDKNYGAEKNYRDALNIVFSSFDRCIFTEDDNEFSPNFLDYMNKGLEIYKDSDKVLSISGYNYPIDMHGYEKNVYATFQFSALGVVLWRDKVQFYTATDFKHWCKSPIKCLKVFCSAPSNFISNIVRYRRNELYGDSCNVAGSIINNKVSIFPTISKVRNWGRDGSGLHGTSSENDPCRNQRIDSSLLFEYNSIPLTPTMTRQIKKYYNKILWGAIKKMIIKKTHIR